MSLGGELNWNQVLAAVHGGCFLGGGGGGSLQEGLKMAQEVFHQGPILLYPVEEMAPDKVVVTVSCVGAPSVGQKMVQGANFLEAFHFFAEQIGEEIQGVIPNENGALATLNGWIVAAMTGLPVVDSPCNGRAHPTALMGSMGLNRIPEYRTWQVAVGGNPILQRDLKVAVYGSLSRTSKLIREASIEAGGLVAVVRNPVLPSYLKSHAAPGGISQAIQLGGGILAGEGEAQEVLKKLQELSPVDVLMSGRVTELSLGTEGGFDRGSFCVSCGNRSMVVYFVNEYMIVEEQGHRRATFPDLIHVLSQEQGQLLTSAELVEGEEVFLLFLDRKYLHLGAGMKDMDLFQTVAQMMGKSLFP